MTDQAVAGLHARAAKDSFSSGSPFASLLALLGNSQDDNASADSTLATLQQSLKTKASKTKDDTGSDAASQLNTVQQTAMQAPGTATAPIEIAGAHGHLMHAKLAAPDVLVNGAEANSTASTDAPAQTGQMPGAANKLSADTQAKLTAELAKTAKIPAASDPTAPTPGTSTTPADNQAAQEVTKATALTKIESAALTNASQQAVHAPAPAQKIEAQALPIQFDASATRTGTQTASDLSSNTNGQSENQSTKEQTADDSRSLDTANNRPVETSTNVAPSNASSAPTTSLSASTASAVSGAAATNSAPSTQQINTALYVAPQSQNDAPAAQPNLAALAVSIAAKSNNGDSQFNISMDPPELGRVEVKLSVDSTGKAQAHLTADQPQTLELLQRDRNTLETSLKDAGVNLSNNGLSFSLKGQDQQNGNNPSAFAQRNRALSVNAIQTIDAGTTAISSTSFAPGDSRLDIRV